MQKSRIKYLNLCNLSKTSRRCQGFGEGGQGGQWPRGPWARERAHLNYIEKWKAHECYLQITSCWPEKQSKYRWKPFFLKSLDFGRENSRNFGEDLFFSFLFWRSHHIWDQTAAFSPSILDFTKPEFHHIWAVPGRTFGSWRPWTLRRPRVINDRTN